MPTVSIARSARVAACALAVAMTACGPAAAADRDPPATAGEGGAPVPIDSALTLFRADLAPVASLRGGSTSIDSLLARLIAAVVRTDTVALRELVMSRAEFAWLYYPTSPFVRTPTKQEPALAWFLHLQASTKGATRLFNRYGGSDLALLANTCAPPKAMGENRLWDDCTQVISVRGDTSVIRLFGGMLERDGRYKIFSYTNDL